MEQFNPPIPKILTSPIFITLFSGSSTVNGQQFAVMSSFEWGLGDGADLDGRWSGCDVYLMD